MRPVYIVVLLLAVLVTACQPPSPQGPPGLKVGKPYAVDGKMYYPAPDDGYDKVGMASWYGPGFHGKYTANGEVYDQNDLTAAHPTLPMPSIVRVTNLESGKSLIVRINDRGPFKSNRIIDLSKSAASKLGISSTAQVRVQYLPQESQEYIAAVQSAGKAISMAEFNAGRQPQRIVEQADASTHAGDTVSRAAPVMTVSSDDINQSSIDAKDVATLKPAAHGPSLVRQAWADDNVTMPEPPAAASAETPAKSDAPAESAKTVIESEPVDKADETPAAKPEAKPAPEHKMASGKGSYIIRAGVYSSEENARKLVARLDGILSSVDEVQMNGKTCWRVHFGPFDDKALAEAALEKVHKSGAPDAILAKQ